jgi:hypothetical protein
MYLAHGVQAAASWLLQSCEVYHTMGSAGYRLKLLLRRQSVHVVPVQLYSEQLTVQPGTAAAAAQSCGTRSVRHASSEAAEGLQLQLLVSTD